MTEVHSAKIGEIVVSRAPDVLEALALGSCVAAFIFDETGKVGACAHVLLPSSNIFGNTKNDPAKPGKYADLAIPETIRIVVQKGGKRERLKAKIAGGARMFELTGKTKNTLDVGARNIEAVRKSLKENQIPIVADDTGEDYGRTVTFDLESMLMTVKLGLKRLKRHL